MFMNNLASFSCYYNNLIDYFTQESHVIIGIEISILYKKYSMPKYRTHTSSIGIDILVLVSPIPS